jgi:hypothetical protein
MISRHRSAILLILGVVLHSVTAFGMSFCVRTDATTGAIRENTAIRMRSTCKHDEKSLPISIEDGEATVRLSGVNLQVVSGSGATDGPVNGRGNVVIGYAEKTCRADGMPCRVAADCAVNRCVPYVVYPQSAFCTLTAQACVTDADCRDNVCGDDRGGSHNLVVGAGHRYSSYGGILGGASNEVSAPSSVAFGQGNVASGFASSVTGGSLNTSQGIQTSVAGGRSNVAGDGTPLPESYGLLNGVAASVAGGRDNVASGAWSVVSGGASNTVTGESAATSGGFANVASGDASNVAGGAGNTASGHITTMCGGSSSTASGPYATVSGGFFNIADGNSATVSGGIGNVAGSSPIPTQFSVVGVFGETVSGGRGNRASGSSATVSGGRSNEAPGDASVVSGGAARTASGADDWVAGGAFQDN